MITNLTDMTTSQIIIAGVLLIVNNIVLCYIFHRRGYKKGLDDSIDVINDAINAQPEVNPKTPRYSAT